MKRCKKQYAAVHELEGSLLFLEARHGADVVSFEVVSDSSQTLHPHLHQYRTNTDCDCN